jgi:hypothetical protein
MQQSIVTGIQDGDAIAGPPRGSPARKLGWRGALLAWSVLQAGGAAALAAALLLLAAIAPDHDADRAGFLRSWGVAFLVVPVTFVPVLARWHSWAVARFGRRPGTFRLFAELAFAAELIGCVLYLRIA